MIRTLSVPILMGPTSAAVFKVMKEMAGPVQVDLKLSISVVCCTGSQEPVKAISFFVQTAMFSLAVVVTKKSLKSDSFPRHR